MDIIIIGNNCTLKCIDKISKNKKIIIFYLILYGILTHIFVTKLSILII